MYIRAFCKAKYNFWRERDTSEIECNRSLAKYVIDFWLSKAVFKDHVFNGFVKVYNMQSNAHQNLLLMGEIINKMFCMEEDPIHDDLFEPFHQLYEQKKG
jgi:hypothetical protein